MKNFMEPEVNVLKFAVEDVIATSSGNEEIGGGGNMLPPDMD